MEECFALFEKQGCDISYVEDFCDETLINDIGIDSALKRKRFLRECAKFCDEIKDFETSLEKQNISALTVKKLKKHGIVTMHILAEEIAEKSDLNLYGIDHEAQRDLLWKMIQNELNPPQSAVSVVDNAHEKQPEGIVRTAAV